MKIDSGLVGRELQTIDVRAGSLLGVRRGSAQMVQHVIGGERRFGRELGHFQCFQDLLFFRIEDVVFVESVQHMMRRFAERGFIEMFLDLFQHGCHGVMFQFDECIGSDPSDIHIVIREQRCQFMRGARIADLFKRLARFPADLAERMMQ